MTDIRRTVLWIVFTMSVVMLWDGWNRHQGHPTMFGMPVEPATSAAPAATGVASSATTATLPGAAGAGASTPQQSASAQPVAPVSQPVVVTTDVVRATIDSIGGTLIKLELLKHAEETDPKQPIVLFDRSTQRTYLAETGLIGAGAQLPTHLTPMHVQPGERQLAPGRDELRVVLESDPQDGVKLIKTYTFKRDSYAVGVKHEVVNAGTTAITPQLYLQLVRDGTELPTANSFMHVFTGPAVYSDAGKYQKLPFEDLAKKKAEFTTHANDGWVAMVQHYFVSIWLHQPGDARQFYADRIEGRNEYRVGMLFPLGTVAPGATRGFDAVLYAGPQEEKRLEALADIGAQLELVKDYGWTRMLARPLFWLLDKIHGLIGNWGWSIVLLVVLLKAAFYTLNANAYRSMAKMKAINPKIMEMRERLKGDPQKMQQEMMRIYREEKVNPLGGCLPILVQIPVFIALYSVLSSSVEMRNAPWILWITDLSVKDPFYVLPALMTLSTLLQTWLNPTPPDPMQAKMMWIMPLVFSVMFFTFPAGLVLYWLTNNLLSIAQQWMINRQLGVTK